MSADGWESFFNSTFGYPTGTSAPTDAPTGGGGNTTNSGSNSNLGSLNDSSSPSLSYAAYGAAPVGVGGYGGASSSLNYGYGSTVVNGNGGGGGNARYAAGGGGNVSNNNNMSRSNYSLSMPSYDYSGYGTSNNNNNAAINGGGSASQGNNPGGYHNQQVQQHLQHGNNLYDYAAATAATSLNRGSSGNISPYDPVPLSSRVAHRHANGTTTTTTNANINNATATANMNANAPGTTTATDSTRRSSGNSNTNNGGNESEDSLGGLADYFNYYNTTSGWGGGGANNNSSCTTNAAAAAAAGGTGGGGGAPLTTNTIGAQVTINNNINPTTTANASILGVGGGVPPQDNNNNNSNHFELDCCDALLRGMDNMDNPALSVWLAGMQHQQQYQQQQQQQQKQQQQQQQYNNPAGSTLMNGSYSNGYGTAVTANKNTTTAMGARPSPRILSKDSYQNSNGNTNPMAPSMSASSAYNLKKKSFHHHNPQQQQQHQYKQQQQQQQQQHGHRSHSHSLPPPRHHHSSNGLITTTTSSNISIPNNCSDHASRPATQIDPLLETLTLNIPAVSLQSLTGSEVLRHIRSKTDDVITRFLPCVDFLVNCQQELRQGLQIANKRRITHHGSRSRSTVTMTPRQFFVTYVAPLPKRFESTNEIIMARNHLRDAKNQLDQLVRDSQDAIPQGCEHVKNAFLGGMRENESWGLRKWLSKHGGAGSICNDLEEIMRVIKNLQKEEETTKRLAEMVRPIASQAHDRLKKDVPQAYQEQSSAHPYLPFFHRLEACLKQMATFNPEEDDVICLDDSDDEDEGDDDVNVVEKVRSTACAHIKSSPVKKKSVTTNHHSTTTAKAPAPAAAASTTRTKRSQSKREEANTSAWDQYRTQNNDGTKIKRAKSELTSTSAGENDFADLFFGGGGWGTNTNTTNNGNDDSDIEVLEIGDDGKFTPTTLGPPLPAAEDSPLNNDADYQTAVGATGTTTAFGEIGDDFNESDFFREAFASNSP